MRCLKKLRLHWPPVRRCSVVTFAMAAAVVSGCGFHRQGVAPISPIMRTAYIDARDERTEFQIELRRSLVASGATIAAEEKNATATVHVARDETGRRVLSVSARNTPREYEVYYSVEYSVSAGGQELLPPQELELTRNYSFDEARLLAKEQEEEILRAEIARDLAGIVMRRLSSL